MNFKYYNQNQTVLFPYSFEELIPDAFFIPNAGYQWLSADYTFYFSIDRIVSFTTLSGDQFTNDY